MRSGTSEAKMAPTRVAEDFSKDSQSAPEDNGRGSSHPNLPLTYADMAIIAADIKSSFSAAMTDLKSSLLVLNERVSTAEMNGKHRDKAINRLDRISTSHTNHLIDMNRHLEDLDNRGRRNNIRVRGIPETVDSDQIIPAL